MEKLLIKWLGVGNPKVFTVEYFTCNKYQLISLFMKPNLYKIHYYFLSNNNRFFLENNCFISRSQQFNFKKQ